MQSQKLGITQGHVHKRSCAWCTKAIRREASRWVCKECNMSVCVGCVPGGGGTPVGTPAHRAKKPACKYGSKCFRTDLAHQNKFVHPGDSGYCEGLVEFEPGTGPELGTLWEAFNFFDPDGSLFITYEEFEPAFKWVAQHCSTALDISKAWEEAGGKECGSLNFTRFSAWAEKAGVKLDVGLEATRDEKLRCHFSAGGGGGCTCRGFDPTEASGGRLCKCGHKRSMHLSETKAWSLQKMLTMTRPEHWASETAGLIKIADRALLQQLQRLLDETHKADSHNWTRDRGCALHGVNRCPEKCIFSNKCPVPTGYTLVSAYRNQNPELWARYSLMRTAISKECGRRDSGRDSVPQFKSIPVDTARCSGCLPGEALVDGVNEWRLFHGTSMDKCKAICNTNFQLSLAGDGATWKKPGEVKGEPLYGLGVYFAERITKADEYAKLCVAHDDDSGERREVYSVLVCLVAGGRTNHTNKDAIDKKDLRDQVFAGPYHSVLGDRVAMGKPFREVVIYDKDQAYPEFLLNYARVYKKGVTPPVPPPHGSIISCHVPEPVHAPLPEMTEKDMSLTLPSPIHEDMSPPTSTERYTPASCAYPGAVGSTTPAFRLPSPGVGSVPGLDFSDCPSLGAELRSGPWPSTGVGPGLGMAPVLAPGLGDPGPSLVARPVHSDCALQPPSSLPEIVPELKLGRGFRPIRGPSAPAAAT